MGNQTPKQPINRERLFGQEMKLDKNPRNHQNQHTNIRLPFNPQLLEPSYKQSNGFKRSNHLPKCKVQGCKQNHDRHYCKNCKNSNSDHFSSKCNNRDGKQSYKTNFNRKNNFNNFNGGYQYNKNVDRMPQNPRGCRVNGCKQNHHKHYCKFCRDTDSDHFSRQCPGSNQNYGNNKSNTGETFYHGTTQLCAKNIIQYQNNQFKRDAYFTPSWKDAAKIAFRSGQNPVNINNFFGNANYQNQTWDQVYQGESKLYRLRPGNNKIIKIVKVHPLNI